MRRSFAGRLTGAIQRGGGIAGVGLSVVRVFETIEAVI
jgi:hypothetical protein